MQRSMTDVSSSSTVSRVLHAWTYCEAWRWQYNGVTASGDLFRIKGKFKTSIGTTKFCNNKPSHSNLCFQGHVLEKKNNVAGIMILLSVTAT